MSYDGWDSEIQRVAAVRALRLLDTPREERFDRITRLAQHLLRVPIALISLVEVDRQWFKSCAGLDSEQTHRGVSFCSHAIAAGRLLEVTDATLDPRFARNPHVLGDPGIRFYAGQPVAAPSGHLVGTLCVIDRVPRELTDLERGHLRDLAAWVQLECAVVQASRWERDNARTRRDFVSVLSHELRTPLTSIHGSLELAMSGRFGELAPQLRRLVGIAARNTDRLVRLAGDVLDLQHMRHGVLRLRLERLALSEVVDHAMQAVEHTARAAGVAVMASCGERAVVRGDGDRLVQVVTNLLANAVRVSTPGSRVRVGCDVSPGWAAITVRDQGPGVPPELLDAIFEPFAQFEVPRQRQAGGAGLGLAITRGIVEAHGGRVRAFPAPGGGSTFEVVLPTGGPAEDRPWLAPLTSPAAAPPGPR
ncbi:GAF domain-containing sensor histidine kinase [Actinokineospora sp. NBRC 105648]|uniref:GAF domain-containing sensor histidine kinase n=1 Tax=Actinokineospora sp. NBRC 105648 TaxID=3032206 RepID=UPI0024A4E8DA|nr:GAF domain-containing sensor histidine kinase [Actinokineospora sp. NBRC 105648]GLZ37338.1 sensor histidine kinase [Actinokineospora sp. NBRC 105648]